MVPRWIRERLQESLQVMPAVFLQGAWQMGKTTSVMQLVEEGLLNAYSSFDDLTPLQAA